MSNTEIIETSQAPDAKPIGLSRTLGITWQTLIEVPSYKVPQQSFGGGTDVVPGVAEIISPLLVCNKSNVSTEEISIRVYRADTETTFMLTNQLPIPRNDMIAIPLNGQFIYTGDILEALASDTNVLDVTMSYTVGQAEEDDIV